MIYPPSPQTGPLTRNTAVRLAEEHLDAMNAAAQSGGIFRDRDVSWLIRHAIETVYSEYFPKPEAPQEGVNNELQTSTNEVLAGSMDNLTSPA